MAKHIHILLGQRPRVITSDRATLTKDDFDESKVKRDGDGKFSSTGGGGAAPKEKPKGAPVLTPHMKETLKAKGFEPTKQKTAKGAVIYHNPKTGVKIHASAHNPEGKATSSLWQSELEGKEAKRGQGSKDLDKLLSRGSPAPSDKPHPDQPPGTMTYAQAKAAAAKEVIPEKPAAPTGAPFKNLAESKGFKLGPLTNTGNSVWRQYTHSNGSMFYAAVSGVDKGKWISGSPGKQTKSGMGHEDLASLLGGKVPPGAQNHFNATPTTVFANQTGTKAATAPAPAKAEPALKEKLADNLGKISSSKYQKAATGYHEPTEAQYHAIDSYTGAGYHAMNGALRSSRGEHVTETSKHVTDYLNKASFPETMVLKRGVKGSFATAILQSIEEGTIFVDHGFVSMSTAQGFQGEMAMHITVPKGSKAAAVSHIGGNLGEEEVLAQRGSRFRVDKIEGNNVHATLLPPKEKKA